MRVVISMTTQTIDLPSLFQSVLDVLEQHRLELNQADHLNQNHGDQMVAVFQVACQAAQDKEGASLAEAMDYAAGLLRQLPQNGSAQVYARGLGALAAQFRQRGIDLDELAPYVRSALGPCGGRREPRPPWSPLAQAPCARPRVSRIQVRGRERRPRPAPQRGTAGTGPAAGACTRASRG